MTALENHNFGEVDIFTEDSRKKLAQLITKLFDHWKLDSISSLCLLGLSPSSRAMLSKYRSGKSGIQNTMDSLDRAGWLLSIHKSLRLLYPHNESIRYTWIKRKNKMFDNRQPIEIMKEEGIIGLAKVSRYLDQLRGA